MDEERLEMHKVLATDNEIDLAVPYYVKEPYEYFDIYLHNTNDYVGYVWFDGSDDYELMKYYGNVGYEIKESYRGNNYALKALRILKEIMIRKKIRAMVFSIEPNNKYSINVAEKLGAEKVGSRKVPPKLGLYTFNGEDVDIYVYELQENKKAGIK